MDIEPLIRRAEQATKGPWRRGATVGRTIYDGLGPDDLIGIMDRKEDAHLVVKMRNEFDTIIKTLSAYQRALEVISSGETDETLSLDWAQHIARTTLASWPLSE